MVERLLKVIPTLAGMKASFAPMEELLEYVRIVPDGFGVFTNLVSNVLLGASFGIKGVINPTFMAFPELQVAIWEAAARGRSEEAIKIYEAFNVLNSAMYEGLKGDELDFMLVSARLRGFDIKRYPRWKREKPSEDGVALLRTALHKLSIKPVLKVSA
jgi:dihydrodipicolinate synthase/N-acetylneuraminate lyase